MKFHEFEAEDFGTNEPAFKASDKVKTIATIAVVKEGTLAVDGIKCEAIESCVVDDIAKVTARLVITEKLIHDGAEYLVQVPAEVEKMEGDDLNSVELEIDSHAALKTPGEMFEIKPGELASKEYISEDIYYLHEESTLRLAQLHDDWLTLKARIRFEMGSKLG